MLRDGNSDKEIYKVVINAQEQYSIWPAARANPMGWKDAGKSGTKEECLEWIKEVWTDMRPPSLQERMEEDPRRKAEEAARRQMEEDPQRKAEEAARRQMEENAQRELEEAARREIEDNIKNRDELGTPLPSPRKEIPMESSIGQIQLFPYDYTPQGWALCDGKIMRISQHQALFSLIGTCFGGGGKTTFALPDLRGKEPAPDMRYCIALAGIYPTPD